MLAVVSPAKSLDFETPPATDRFTTPRLIDDAAALAGVMASKTAPEISRLMSISPALGALNAERFAGWSEHPGPPEARQALLAFDGDVYRGLDAPATFSTRDFTRAQKTLRILSGLYGLLRPLDLILPYRLEMGTRLPNPRGADLSAYWRPRVTDVLRADLEASPGPAVLVNLASREYFGAVDEEALGARVVAPVFLDVAAAGGEPKIISFHAKRARGAMAGWLVRERVDRLRDLPAFDGLGYRYDPERSAPDAPVFVRGA
jgi:cytoplasmic iron level regulating protein YaaA (DUF328/UPF0246 family)